MQCWGPLGPSRGPSGPSWGPLGGLSGRPGGDLGDFLWVLFSAFPPFWLSGAPRRPYGTHETCATHTTFELPGNAKSEDHEEAYSWLRTFRMLPGSGILGTRKTQTGLHLAPGIQNVASEWCFGTAKSTKWPTVGSGHSKCGLGMVFWQDGP